MMQSSGGGLVYDDAWAIRDNLSGVKSVDVTQNSSESVKSGDVTVEEVTIMGTTTGFPSVRDMTLAAGRYVTQNDIDRKARVAVLGSSLAASCSATPRRWGRWSTWAMSS